MKKVRVQSNKTLVFATSERTDGNMGFSAALNNRAAKRNRSRFLRRLGVNPSKLIYGKQVHGSRIAKIQRLNVRLPIPDTDGFVTDIPGVVLGVFSADCFPVFFYSRDRAIIGLAHAGWRGVVRRLAPRMVEILKQYGVKARDIFVKLGPAIRACHFEVQKDTSVKFKLQRRFILRRNGKTFIDLAGIIAWQLRASGIPSANIKDTKQCTFHSDRFFSYRREKNAAYPKGFGNMLSCIAMQHEKKAVG